MHNGFSSTSALPLLAAFPVSCVDRQHSKAAALHRITRQWRRQWGTHQGNASKSETPADSEDIEWQDVRFSDSLLWERERESAHCSSSCPLWQMISLQRYVDQNASFTNAAKLAETQRYKFRGGRRISANKSQLEYFDPHLEKGYNSIRGSHSAVGYAVPRPTWHVSHHLILLPCTSSSLSPRSWQW